VVLAAGLTFATGQFAISNLVGPELTDVLAALASLAAVALLLKVWRPASDRTAAATAAAAARIGSVDTRPRVIRAYATYGILVAAVLIGQSGNFAGMSSVPPPANLTALLKCGQAGNKLCPDPWIGQPASVDPQAARFPVWEFNWPGAYRLDAGKPAAVVQREPPIVPKSTPYPLTFRLDFLAASGSLCFFGAILAFVLMLAAGVSPSTFTRVLGQTLRQLRLPIVTIAFILSIATVMNYSGMTSSMALALARTGWWFPFFSAWLGMLGVFLTGSDTASNTLFGPLQATTASVAGLNPILMGATNSSAGVMGKMISPQNLSVGAAGVGAVGREGDILKRVIVHSLILTTVMGVVAMLQAYVVPWMVPTLGK
jgi:lactate permease